MVWFSFILTEKCDWDCCYCQFPLLDQTNGMQTKTIDKHVPYISDVITKTQSIAQAGIEIQGGEIGLIEKDTLKLFLKTLNHKVFVSTNGEFLKRGYHLDEDIRRYIKEVQWHLCPSPGNYKLDVDYNDDGLFINKGIVHTDIDEMVMFIKQNPQISFNYVELECDIRKPRTYRTEDIRHLYERIQEFDNVSESALQTLERRLKDKGDKHDKCAKYHSVISINMANETICLCQRAMEVNISLTKENLIKRMKQYPVKVFDIPDEISGCDSCIRLFSGKFQFIAILRDTLKLRRCDFEN